MTNREFEEEFKKRTKAFALECIVLVESLPRSRTADVLGRQLIRSAASVGSNYRAACRARSRADMIAKLGIVEEEADESIYWLELLHESGTSPAERLKGLMREGEWMLAVLVKSLKTLKLDCVRENGQRIQNPKHQTLNSKLK